MARKKIHTDNFRGRIRAMKLGDVILFPIEKESLIRSTANIVGVLESRRYSVHRNWDRRVVSVERSE